MRSRHITRYSFSLVALLIALGLGNCSCEEETDLVDGDELTGDFTMGVIKFEITYPYYDKEGFMATMMPDEMYMRIKDNKFRNEISQGIFRTVFIADNQKKELRQQLYFWSKKIAVKLSEQETSEFVDDFDKVTISYTEDTDTIAGYLCKKAIAEFEDPEMPSIDLYYTNEIDLKDANWCNQFKEIDGVLLQYEVERYGLRMRFKALEIYHEEIPDGMFQIEEGYKYVSAEEMDYEMEEIFSTLLE